MRKVTLFLIGFYLNTLMWLDFEDCVYFTVQTSLIFNVQLTLKVFVWGEVLGCMIPKQVPGSDW